MNKRLMNIDRDTPMLFPVDMRDWLPENHLVHFVVDAVQQLGVRSFKTNERSSGSEQFPPEMMLSLLIYSYATGRFGSRTIEAATYTDVALRYICGDRAHPDHSVICAFRKNNKEIFAETFVKILLLAHKLKKLKKVGGISVDGSKVRANASKHKAVSYKRAGELIEKLQGEVAELMKMAESADASGLDDGLFIPDEIQRREDRLRALTEAREEMEKMFAEAEQAGCKKGKKLDTYQHNFTDSDSRIMPTSSKNTFEQSFNTELAVDTEGSQLILGGYVTQRVNDKQELLPIVESVPTDVREVSTVCADSGFYSASAVESVERVTDDGNREGPEVYCAVEKSCHGMRIDDLKKSSPPGRPPANLSGKEKMKRKLKTKKGKRTYKKRKETVEPVFGIIKHVMGFRQFMLRGIEKVNIEWTLVRVAYNFKRLHTLTHGRGLPKCKV